jgi:hypothetical protein
MPSFPKPIKPILSMNIPLDNLYHWVESQLPQPAMLYLFYPHGNKNISGITALRYYNTEHFSTPQVICHDQEPLDFGLYEHIDINQINQERVAQGLGFGSQYQVCFDYLNKEYATLNIRAPVQGHNFRCFYDQMILLHSEKNSKDLDQYLNNGFIGVYYWSHAVIARDWYRYAAIDTRLAQQTTTKTFLIYCRDWSHRREYRLKFLELLTKQNLVDQCQVSVMKINSEGNTIDTHNMQNPEFKLDCVSSIDSIPDNSTSSSISGYYCAEDFATTKVSIVLETEFDTARIHLTEKILRAIACGHPFILAAAPGSLKYLRDYGFETFAPYIDESYDNEVNSGRRLEMIVKSMKSLTAEQIASCQSIAERNKKYFFSEEFFNRVSNELKENLAQAFGQVYKTKGTWWRDARKKLKQLGPTVDGILYDPISRKRMSQLRHYRQSYE